MIYDAGRDRKRAHLGVVTLPWAPDWAFAPGSKGHPALRDWQFHPRAFAIGVVAGGPFALLVTVGLPMTPSFLRGREGSSAAAMV